MLKTPLSSGRLLRLAACIIVVAVGVSAANARLPKLSPMPVNTYTVDSIKADMDSRPLHHIEGIWMMTETSAKVAIELESGPTNSARSTDATAYRMVLLTSPNRALRPGTLMGRIVPSAKEGIYQAEIYSSAIGSRLSNPAKFTVELDKTDNRIILTRHQNAFSVNLWRALPYMWRYVVRKNQPTPTYHGCVRLYPPPVPPLQPIYL